MPRTCPLGKTSQHKSHLPEQSERVQQIRADWANKCNSSKFRQHPDFKRRRRRKIKAVEDARKLDRIDWLEGLGKEATAADEAGDIKELHRIRRILQGKSTAFSNTKPQNITENGITRPFTDDAERIEHCACFCESKFAEPPDSNPLPDIGSASSRLDDPDTAVTREEFEFALRTLAETKAAGWDDVVAEQYQYCAAAADELFRERHIAQLRGRPATGTARSMLPRRPIHS